MDQCSDVERVEPRACAPDPAAYVLAPETLAPETMTASEQMFFLHAPLAHVVRFEDELHRKRGRHADHRHRSLNRSART
jgi:hypothetical protein